MVNNNVTGVDANSSILWWLDVYVLSCCSRLQSCVESRKTDPKELDQVTANRNIKPKEHFIHYSVTYLHTKFILIFNVLSVLLLVYTTCPNPPTGSSHRNYNSDSKKLGNLW